MVNQLIGIALMTLIASIGGSESNAARTSDNLLQGVKAEQSAYALGETMRFIYTIRNQSNSSIIYNFTSSKLFDIWVKLGDKEVYRWSRGRVYLTVMTTLALDPGETREFKAEWNQKDNSGKDVGPGVYEIYAQLQPSEQKPPVVKTKVKIGKTRLAVESLTVAEAIRRSDKLLGRQVSITATYRGFKPDPKDSNTKSGPPVTRSDWAICDSTGCMYVNGPTDLKPEKDIGARVLVVGKVRKTPRGQVYLTLDNATRQRGQ